MNEVHVAIYILPIENESFDLNLLEGYSEQKVGKVLSSNEEINVNAVNGGFSVIFSEDEILRCTDHTCLLNNLITIFVNNFTIPDVHLSVYYLYNIRNNPDDWYFDTNVALKVMELCDAIATIIHAIPENAAYNVQYEATMSIQGVIADYYASMSEDDDFDDEEDPTDFYEDLKSQSFETKPSMDDMFPFLSEFVEEDSDPFKIEEDAKKKRTKRKKDYGSSKSLKVSKNPKKYYKRHGVIISSKSAIKSDRKKLKEFLEDFIPGSSDWKKKLRKDLVVRWMNSYALTANDLKKLEKKHKKNMDRLKRMKYNQKTSMDVVRKVLTEPIDQWYNPKR